MSENSLSERQITSFLGLVPTGEQKQLLIALQKFFLEDKEDFFIIDGSAGTGKTVMMSACSRFLASRNIPYKLAAPTGRAARILASKTNVSCSTIHSLIYEVDSDPDEGIIRFQLKPNENKDHTVFIIDESSMVSSNSFADEESMFASGNRVLEDLIHFIKEGNELNKIVFVGDRNQLPPVKETFSAALSSEYLKENFNLKGSFMQLSMVRRQDTQSPLYAYIKNIKESIEGTSNPIPTKNVFQIHNQLSAEYNYVIDYRNHGPEFCTAIAYAHKKNTQFNETVRSILFENHQEKLVPGELLLITRTLKKQDYTLYNGDHVIVKEVDLENVKRLEGLNFVKIVLIAKDISGEEVEISDYMLLDSLDFPKGLPKEKEKALHQNRIINNKVYRENGNAMEDPYLGAIRALYGYSITIHKAQGGEWNKVYISDWYPDTNYYKSKYTAFTRAIDEVFIYN